MTRPVQQVDLTQFASVEDAMLRTADDDRIYDVALDVLQRYFDAGEPDYRHRRARKKRPRSSAGGAFSQSVVLRQY